MRILGIETSCDETATAVVEDGWNVLAHCLASSAPEHALYGGVLPELAARRQAEYIIPLLDAALLTANVSPGDLDAIAVTKGPGLLTSLLIGVTAARTFSSVHGIPLIGIHHTLGHLTAPWLGSEIQPCFPCLSLSVSGGHTELWHRLSHTTGELLGKTLDDAAGEAFDKGAIQLGLPYPGGPSLSRLAEKGDRHAFTFPSPLSKSFSYDFSFSGLKTSLKYLLRDLGGIASLSHQVKADIAASYEEAICLHLMSRIQHALASINSIREVHITGGVSANARLRSMLASLEGVEKRTPLKLAYCTDNAAMIAAAGYYILHLSGECPSHFEASANLPHIGGCILL